MQPDMMKMAQQSQNKQQAPQQQMNEAQFNEEFKKAGLPQGNDKEAMKARLLALLEQSGFLKNLNQAGLKDLTIKIEEYVELLMKGDKEGVKNHPISRVLEKIVEPALQQRQQAPMGAAPKNFAGMMKPPGGGMSGR